MCGTTAAALGLLALLVTRRRAKDLKARAQRNRDGARRSLLGADGSSSGGGGSCCCGALRVPGDLFCDQCGAASPLAQRDAASNGGAGGGGGGSGGSAAALVAFTPAQLSAYTNRWATSVVSSSPYSRLTPPLVPLSLLYLLSSLACTNRWARALGAGAFGSVYAGVLPDGRQVAVKQVDVASAAEQETANKKGGRKRFGGGRRLDPYKGEAGFRRELEVLSKYVHPNLVTLLGHCVEKKKRTVVSCSLVLEFMPEGSLLGRLRPTRDAMPLTAQQRFDVAADVARALHYLHAEASPPLIHQDVKSDNILLAEDGGGRLIAKVADFGTARMAPQLAQRARGGSSKTHHSTRLIVGTRPYMPMEYLQMGQVSEKTDTFAYGVVLLELLTGRPPYDDETDTLLHADSMELLCDPERRLAPLLDARVPSTAWATVAAAGTVRGRALELCLVAKRCLEMLAAVRGTMREAMPKVVALAAAHRRVTMQRTV